MAGHAVDIARGQLARAGNPAVQLLQEDVFTHQPAEPYDWAVASMCFHHFSDAQILALLQRLRGFVRNSVLINDLRRSRWRLWRQDCCWPVPRRQGSGMTPCSPSGVASTSVN
jgi:hypothetical protein